jgi:hypothetical protein
MSNNNVEIVLEERTKKELIKTFLENSTLLEVTFTCVDYFAKVKKEKMLLEGDERP